MEFIIFVGFTLPPPVMDKERETGTGRSKKKKSVLLKRARVCLCGIVLLEIYIKNLHNITRDSEIDLLKYSTVLYENKFCSRFLISYENIQL